MSEHPPSLGPFELYEMMVQDPLAQTIWLESLLQNSGARGRRLGEDFAGTAALSRQWVERVGGATALAIDIDEEALLFASEKRGVERRLGDVLEQASPEDAAELIFVGNFSIGYLWERSQLLRYLRLSLERLSDSGLLVIEIYGGASAWRSGSARRLRPLGGGWEVEFRWEQRDADISSGMVSDFLHFRLLREGEVHRSWHEAFRYRLRLWSLPELNDALSEVGFSQVELFDLRDPPSEGPRRILSGEDLGEGYLAWVVARK